MFYPKITKQSKQASVRQEISAKILAVWSPYGADTSSYSYRLATEISKFSQTVLIELPCHGIPRLSVASGIKDRDNHFEAVLIDLAKQNYIKMERIAKKSPNLAILTADFYATPDSPVFHKVEQQIMISFPALMIDAARNNGYQQVIFECQGQLPDPMTFYALKKADVVLIPIDKPSEVAFALINLKRLFSVYEYEDQKFKIIATDNAETLADTMTIFDDDGRQIGKPEVYCSETREVLNLLGMLSVSPQQGENMRMFKNFFRKNRTDQEAQALVSRDGFEKEQKTIRL